MSSFCPVADTALCYNTVKSKRGKAKYAPRAGEMTMKFRRAMAVALVLAMIFATPAMAASSQTKQVVSVALKQLGKPYALYPDSPSSFNCASLISYCCNKVSSGKITRGGVSGGAAKITSLSKVGLGDIVCFKSSGNESGVPGCHFGIYVGKGYFIHASSSAKKVIVSKVKNYSGRFVGALRVF